MRRRLVPYAIALALVLGLLASYVAAAPRTALALVGCGVLVWALVRLRQADAEAALDLAARHHAEAVASARERELRLVADAVPVLIAYCDRDCRYRFANQAYAARFGLTPDAVVGKHVREVAGEEAWQAFRGDIDRALDGETIELEAEVPYAGIGPHFMRMNYVPARGPDGAVIGLVAALLDITVRREVELALRESEERFRALFDDSPISLSEQDWSLVRVRLDELRQQAPDLRSHFAEHPEDAWDCLRSIRQVRINRAGLRLFGVESVDELGASIARFFEPESRDALMDAFVQIATGERRVRGEDVLRTIRGERRPVLFQLTVLPGHEATLDCILVSLIDITEERRAEAERSASARRAEFLVEATSVLTASLDFEETLRSVARLAVPFVADWCTVDVLERDGTIRRVALAHADVTKADIVRTAQTYPPDPEGRHPRTRVLRTGESILIPEVTATAIERMAGSAEHLTALRSLAYRSAMIVPLVARGEVLGAITVATAESGRRYVRDDLALAEELARRAGLAVDNARLYREAQDASRLKDEFLSIVSHELRTPLAAMLGWVRVLRTDRTGERATRALETIERSGRAQAKLIDDLLDMSRIVTGRLRLDLRPVSLPALLDAAIDTVRPAAEAKGVRLLVTIDRTLGPVAGDPDRLQQIAWNLLSNAVKFTPSGGAVEVRLEQRDGTGRIVVRDSGSGISPAFLERIFERFQQANASTARGRGGLGLGLAIVRHLVELHGGTVTAASQGEGRGATFTVDLPLNPLAEGAAPPWRFPPAERAAVRLDGVRVLLVDDESDVRAALRAMLEQRGASVTAVTSTREALAALDGPRPHVLVSDIRLPDSDGYTLLRLLRAEPEMQGVPAVAVTGFREEDRTRAFAAGYQVHLTKPVEPDDIAAAIATLATHTGTPH